MVYEEVPTCKEQLGSRTASDPNKLVSQHYTFGSAGTAKQLSPFKKGNINRVAQR